MSERQLEYLTARDPMDESPARQPAGPPPPDLHQLLRDLVDLAIQQGLISADGPERQWQTQQQRVRNKMAQIESRVARLVAAGRQLEAALIDLRTGAEQQSQSHVDVICKVSAALAAVEQAGPGGTG